MVAMDFFTHQDRARRNTVWLVVLMAVAFGGIVVMTYAVIAGCLVAAAQSEEMQAEAVDDPGWWQPEIFAIVAAGVAAVVGSGSLYKTMQLSGGGGSLAELLGGRIVLGDSPDPLDRRVLNVVEEMAIAAGTPVPPVYLLDRESSINAFAAGKRLDDAVIGITRGAAEKLSRDELQGVVAHEFSHILHGDMRLNTRLVALVHGILVLGLLGYYLLRVAFHTRSSSSSKDSGLQMGLGLLGLAIMVIGYVGTVIGSLIKAAVSRQREFLADASAVQFTRNPDGLAGALSRIAEEANSQLSAPHAAEASHMFFTSGVMSLFATHPPLAERIARIDASRAASMATDAIDAGHLAGLDGNAAVAGFAGGTPIGVKATAAVAAIGEPTATDLRAAHRVLEDIPQRLRAAAHEPFGCRAVIYAMLLDSDNVIRVTQLAQLNAQAEPGVATETRRLETMVRELPRSERLALVDLAVSTLKALSAAQYRRFRETVEVLIETDSRLDIFEWVLQKILVRHLDHAFGIAVASPRRGRGTRQDVSILLSSLAHAGTSSATDARAACDRGCRATGLTGLAFLDRDQVRLDAVSHAVDALASIKPDSKHRLMDAMAMVVSHDGVMTPDEAELLRGFADTLDCPMPLAAGAIERP